MIIGFNPRFIGKILSGTKIHTIRADVNDQWKQGREIQFATGVRTKFYEQFKYGVCVSVQKIKIEYCGIVQVIYVDGKKLGIYGLSRLARNDGFNNLDDFFEWFNKDFTGKIIHWTGFRY